MKVRDVTIYRYVTSTFQPLVCGQQSFQVVNADVAHIVALIHTLSDDFLSSSHGLALP